VHDPGFGERKFLLEGSDKLLPAYVALVAASAQPVAPSPLGMLEDHFEHFEIATDTLVLVVATQFRTERPILLLQWRMAVVTTPCPNRLHKPAQSFPDRFALEDPVSTACFGPIVGKSKKVEVTRPPCRCLSTWRPLERNQRRLFGMNGQPETVEPLRQDGHHPARVGFQLAADDEIIGKARHKAPALHPGLHVFDKPFVQDLMQEHVGQ
jgi:hypothetical protein